MKNNNLFYLVLSACLLLISCSDLSNNSDSGQRFSNELDTFYKTNSTEIESIERTFYKKGDIISNYIAISQKVGQKSYRLMIYDKDNKENNLISVSTLNDDTKIEQMFKDMQIVLSNPGKMLDYRFGELQNGRIRANGNNEISISIDGNYQYLNKAEIDSMQSCYNRFKKELK